MTTTIFCLLEGQSTNFGKFSTGKPIYAARRDRNIFPIKNIWSQRKPTACKNRCSTRSSVVSIKTYKTSTINGLYPQRGSKKNKNIKLGFNPSHEPWKFKTWVRNLKHNTKLSHKHSGPLWRCSNSRDVYAQWCCLRWHVAAQWLI